MVEKARELTFLSDKELSFLEQSLLDVRHLNGNIVMAGVFKGGDVIALGSLIKKYNMNKRVIVVDSFRGLAAPCSRDLLTHQTGEGTCDVGGVEVFKENIAPYGVLDICDIYEMWIDNNSIKQVPAQSLSLIWLDVDHYTPTAACMHYFYPMLELGGIMLTHDFGVILDSTVIRTGALGTPCAWPGVQEAASEISKEWKTSKSLDCIGYLKKE